MKGTVYADKSNGCTVQAVADKFKVHGGTAIDVRIIAEGHYTHGFQYTANFWNLEERTDVDPIW